MQRQISLDMLRADCNLGRLKIQNLTIASRLGEHTSVVIDALPDPDKAGYVGSELSGQPISVRVEDSKDEILFYGAIFEATERWEAGFLTLRIAARSLSWLLDLEKKSRSFQKTERLHMDIINAILEEYGASAISNFQDRPIDKPYIQYDETDWEFILRISSRLGARVFPSSKTIYPGIYIGFPERDPAASFECTTYRFGLDDMFIRNRGADRRQYVYYEVEDFVPRQIGDSVLFQGAVWRVSEVSAQLDKGVLRFVYRLTGIECNRALPEHNPFFRGLSLTGTVLDRQSEKLRLHLDIDEEQNVEDAYLYSWLPETGNIMYNMPPLGTRVSLYMQSTDEHSAICIRSIRENGAACALTQDPEQRFLTTEAKKSLSMKPETMDILAMESGDCALIDDNFGCRFASGKEMLIQAGGNISISGATVKMHAPQEMTAVRRSLGEPTVVNLCHNVDTIGGKGQFQATGRYSRRRKSKKGELTVSEYGQGEESAKAEQEKRKKLKFEMAELLRQSDDEPRYDITDVFKEVLAAVPQRTARDKLAKFSAGSRVLVGNWEGEIPSATKMGKGSPIQFRTFGDVWDMRSSGD
ncbi:MAG: phage late control D family protein [Peptococcaceae bacterium]|nr:phage late control D family protein [Peptococcaceae bacterium]